MLPIVLVTKILVPVGVDRLDPFAVGHLEVGLPAKTSARLHLKLHQATLKTVRWT